MGSAGGDDEGFKYYRDRIAEVSGRYEKVLMLGDSMGELHQIRISSSLLLQVLTAMNNWRLPQSIRLSYCFILHVPPGRELVSLLAATMRVSVAAVGKHDVRLAHDL